MRGRTKSDHFMKWEWHYSFLLFRPHEISHLVLPLMLLHYMLLLKERIERHYTKLLYNFTLASELNRKGLSMWEPFKLFPFQYLSKWSYFNYVSMFLPIFDQVTTNFTT